MKEYKLVQFNGNTNEGTQKAGNVGTTGGTQSNVYHTFGTETAGTTTAGQYGTIGGNAQGNVGTVYGTFGETAQGTGVGGVFGNTTGVQTENGATTGVNAGTIQGTQFVAGNPANLPKKIGLWGKVKNFLFSEVTVELTPTEQKVFKEVHDFWFQDIYFPELHDFLFRDITLSGKKKKK